MLGEEIQHAVPHPAWKLVPHPCDGFQPRAADGTRRCIAPGRVDHPVAVAVDHQRRNVDLGQFAGAVTGPEDGRELTWGARARLIAFPRDRCPVAHALLVEREAVRADVAEYR